MTIFKTLITGLMTLGLLAGINAYADHNHDYDHQGYHAEKRERMFKRMVRKLDLTEDQQQQIRSIKDSAKAEIADTRQAMHESRKALRQAVQAGAGEAEVQELLIAQTDEKARLIVHRAETMRAIEAVLTEEQREKFTEMREQRKKKMQKRWNKHASAGDVSHF